MFQSSTISPSRMFCTMNGNVWMRDVMSASSLSVATSYTQAGIENAHMIHAVHRWYTCNFSWETPVTIPIRLTFVASTLRKVRGGALMRPRTSTYRRNGRIAIDIHPDRVAMGGLWPIAIFGHR